PRRRIELTGDGSPALRRTRRRRRRLRPRRVELVDLPAEHVVETAAEALERDRIDAGDLAVRVGDDDAVADGVEHGLVSDRRDVEESVGEQAPAQHQRSDVEREQRGIDAIEWIEAEQVEKM